MHKYLQVSDMLIKKALDGQEEDIAFGESAKGSSRGSSPHGSPKVGRRHVAHLHLPDDVSSSVIIVIIMILIVIIIVLTLIIIFITIVIIIFILFTFIKISKKMSSLFFSFLSFFV